MKLVTGRTADVARFVSSQIDTNPDFGACEALGVEREGALVAGVVYNNYRGHDIHMHVAGNGLWLNRALLRAFFAYPFEQLGCVRVSSPVPLDNFKCRRFITHLGFTLEGLQRKAFDGVKDLLWFGLLREECRFLSYGQKSSQGT